jgi:hypothetical protein
MGRPRTVAPDSHIQQLNIYISAEDYVWLTGLATAQNLSRAEVIRRLIATARQEAR